MGSDPAITVEVTISEELRGLLALMRDMPAPVALPPGQVVAPAMPDRLDASPVVWPEVRLRRDGQRPMLFRGLPVMSRLCTADLAAGTAEQRLTLYVAEGDLLYASLVFEPPETACARPSHRCQPIRDRDEFELFLKAWHPESHLETVFASGPQHQESLAAGQVAVRSSFITMAADCLSKGVLHS
jgi:hypothetical protein